MISIFAVVDKNRAIGCDSFSFHTLIRNEDSIEELITNKTSIVGYKTFREYGLRNFFSRHHIVLTEDPMSRYSNHKKELFNTKAMFGDLLDTLCFIDSSPQSEFIIVGGEETYNLFLPYVNNVYLFEIDHIFPNTKYFFPSINTKLWKKSIVMGGNISISPHYKYTLYSLKRKNGEVIPINGLQSLVSIK